MTATAEVNFAQTVNNACDLVTRIARNHSLPEGVSSEEATEAAKLLKSHRFNRIPVWEDAIQLTWTAIDLSAQEKARARENERLSSIEKACNLVEMVANNDVIPLGMDTPPVVEATRLLRETFGPKSSWEPKIRKAWDAIDRVATAKAEARERDRQRASVAAAAAKIAAEEEARKARHAKNLRHLENKAKQAEENRKMAGKSGCGTQQKREGKKK